MDPATAANIGLILTGAGVVLAFLAFLDIKLPGPHLLARLWARIQAKEVKELQKKTDDQATQIAELKQLVEDLLIVVNDTGLHASVFPHEPEVTRVRQAAKAILERKN